jgi:hypothetical protein
MSRCIRQASIVYPCSDTPKHLTIDPHRFRHHNPPVASLDQRLRVLLDASDQIALPISPWHVVGRQELHVVVHGYEGRLQDQCVAKVYCFQHVAKVY